MWPKAFAQLIELAPHISRLLPMADRYFQSKNTAEDGNRRAIESLAEALRGDLGKIAGAQTVIYKQIEALSGSVAAIASDAEAAKVAALAAADSAKTNLTDFSGIEGRLTAMETRLDRLGDRLRMTPVVLLLVLTNLILLACVVVLLVHRHPAT